MKIAVLSLFPEMFDSFLSASILGRARTEGLLDVRPVDIRPYSDKKHKNTDDYPFGGGAGMVHDGAAHRGRGARPSLAGLRRSLHLFEPPRHTAYPRKRS